MSPRRIARAVLALLAGAGLASAAPLPARAAPQSAKGSSPAKSQAPQLGAPQIESDRGRFSIVAGGSLVGSEDFQISPNGADWVARSRAEIHQPGAPAAEITATLNLAPDGMPMRYDWKIDGPKKASATVEFSGGKATVELRVPGARPYVQEFDFSGRRVVILDNNIYSQYAILAWLYDARAGGPQSFAVFVPQAMTPGTITVESLGTQEIEGPRYTILRARTSDLSLQLLLDGRRLMRILVPSAAAVISRQ